MPACDKNSEESKSAFAETSPDSRLELEDTEAELPKTRAEHRQRVAVFFALENQTFCLLRLRPRLEVMEL